MTLNPVNGGPEDAAKNAKPIFGYSIQSDYHRCGKYYELKHIMGHDDGGSKSVDMAFGTCCHMGMEEILSNKGDGKDLFSIAWKTHKDKEFGRLSWEQLHELGLSLLSQFTARHKSKFSPVHLEAEMRHDFGRYILKGTADFLGTYNGIPSIVDWKTASRPYDEYKIVTNEQLYVYASLAKSVLGYEAKQVVYGVLIKDVKGPRFQFKTRAIDNWDAVDKMMDNVHNTCNAILDSKLFLRDSASCQLWSRPCPFLDKCFGEVL